MLPMKDPQARGSRLDMEKTSFEETLTNALAERVLGWTRARGRFICADRKWLPRWRFQPLRNIADAFQLLEAARPLRYQMGSDPDGELWVRVEIAGLVGEARHTSQPRAITFAVARALGIELEGEE
jgi:hypothetical protein